MASSSTLELPSDDNTPAASVASLPSSSPPSSAAAPPENPTVSTPTITTTTPTSTTTTDAVAASMKSSRWSDSSTADATAVSEPPLKKVRNDTPSNPGYGEAPPGLASGYASSQASSVTNTILPNLTPIPAAAAAPAATPAAAPVPIPAPSVYGGDLSQQPTQTGYPQSYGYGGVSFAPGSAKANGGLFYKTKLCTKFKIGACTFNERCHFAHGMEDLRKPSPGWESVVMASSSSTTTTTTSTALSNTMPRPKTRPCRYFISGNCPYGDRCNFLHGAEEAHNNNKSWGGGGGYQPTAMIQAPASAVDYSAYSNGTTLQNQYAHPNQAVANPSMMNPPQLIAAYGAQTDHSVTAPPNMNPYASAPPVNPYSNAPQDGSANYNYWNNATTTTNPPQMYIQPNQTTNNQGNQTASWMPNTYAPDGYGQSTTVPQYSQVPPQPVMSGPYMQPGATYSAPHAEATYQIQQQPDYATMYNMPGKI